MNTLITFLVTTLIITVSGQRLDSSSDREKAVGGGYGGGYAPQRHSTFVYPGNGIPYHAGGGHNYPGSSGVPPSSGAPSEPPGPPGAPGGPPNGWSQTGPSAGLPPGPGGSGYPPPDPSQGGYPPYQGGPAYGNYPRYGNNAYGNSNGVSGGPPASYGPGSGVPPPPPPPPPGLSPIGGGFGPPPNYQGPPGFGGPVFPPGPYPNSFNNYGEETRWIKEQLDMQGQRPPLTMLQAGPIEKYTGSSTGYKPSYRNGLEGGSRFRVGPPERPSNVPSNSYQSGMRSGSGANYNQFHAINRQNQGSYFGGFGDGYNDNFRLLARKVGDAAKKKG